MRVRQSSTRPLPRLWLVSDRRNDHLLERALRRLPAGAGFIFRHHHLETAERRRRYERLARIARARGILVAVSGDAATARRWRAEAVYSPPPPVWEQCKSLGLARLANVHDRYELAQARRNRADAVIISPVFPTRTHPDAPALGRRAFLTLGRVATMPVIALGGMTHRRAQKLPAYGWAAIDGLS